MEHLDFLETLLQMIIGIAALCLMEPGTGLVQSTRSLGPLDSLPLTLSINELGTEFGGSPKRHRSVQRACVEQPASEAPERQFAIQCMCKRLILHANAGHLWKTRPRPSQAEVYQT